MNLFTIPLKYIDVASSTLQIWMCYKKNVFMTDGMSIRADICQILGQDSQSLLCWKRNLQRDICGPRRDWPKDLNEYQTKSCMARSLDETW